MSQFENMPSPDYFLFWQEIDREGSGNTFMFDKKFPDRKSLQDFVVDLPKKNTLCRGSLRVITGYEVELVEKKSETT